MNLVYDALSRNIPGRAKRGQGGWTNFNAVCCQYNGESRPDTRNRGGLRMSGDSCVYHCFNCKYSASWTPGHNLSRKMENLLDWFNIGLTEKKKIKFKVWQLWMNAKSATPIAQTAFVPKSMFSFDAIELPGDAKPFSHWLDPKNFHPDFPAVAAYMLSRGEDLFDAYEYYWSPSTEHNLNQRVIIPFWWDGKIVGWNARDIVGDLKYKYFASTPPNYIFNTESIDYDNQFIFVCEGAFDALSIGGVAMLGDKITNEQADWLDDTGKKIIIVADREKAGGTLVQMAMERGWYVSLLEKLGDDVSIKDAAQSVQELGKLYTLLAIMDSRTNNKFQIGVWSRMALVKTKGRYE